MGMALSVVQELLADKAAFTPRGQFVDRVDGSNACGGVVSDIWGTELGSRKDKALIAWDYDVDLMAHTKLRFRQLVAPGGRTN